MYKKKLNLETRKIYISSYGFNGHLKSFTDSVFDCRVNTFNLHKFYLGVHAYK